MSHAIFAGNADSSIRRFLILVVSASLALTSLTFLAGPAEAAGRRVELRALLVDGGDPTTDALGQELQRQGIPFTRVDLGSEARPVITPEFLADDVGGVARYQAVFLPNQAGGGLSEAEMAALGSFEAEYGVRQVNAYDWARPELGFQWADYSGAMDGAALTVSPEGLAGPFEYLSGQLTVDDAVAADEYFGHLAQPLPQTDPTDPTCTWMYSLECQGITSFTPLMSATQSGATGVVMAAVTRDGREELVITANYGWYSQWFNVVAEGIVSWATRGIHTGYNRNYLNVHIDDVLMPDSRWSVEGNCTPGDDCVDPTISTTDIRMTAADVDRLLRWQDSAGVSLDMVFNASGAVDAAADNGGSDPLTEALLANKDQFRWVNHTYSHPYLGCIQIAPTEVGQLWTCMTEPDQQPRQDDTIEAQLSSADGVYYASQQMIEDQITSNLAWARDNGITLDPSELVTGEHSGLRSLPQQPADNPFLAPALRNTGVRVTASDASREPDVRQLDGGYTSTAPRHPMNIFYNAATYQEEVDEYNWIYTSVADGGSGICERFPETTTCITPLPADNASQARASFDGYILPIETRNALRFILSNDPRPFYAHQSNLAEDGILYPVLDSVIDTYKSVIDWSSAPLVQSSPTEQRDALSRLDAWRAASDDVIAYVDSNGVHVPDAAADIPLTVPAGSSGAGLQPYAGTLSGWLSASAAVAVPGGSGGYLVEAEPAAPGAPTSVVATATDGAATVAWVAPAASGTSPIESYVVRALAGGSVVTTVSVAADATSVEITGLANGTAYQFDVAATNAVGTGPASELTDPVTPQAALSPVPQAVLAAAGNGSVYATWQAPQETDGLTGYVVRAAEAGTGTVVATATVDATRTGATVLGLANGTAYTVDVAAEYGAQVGPASDPTAEVTPQLGAQTDAAPSITGTVAGNGSATVSWAAPADLQGRTPSGYRVTAFAGATGTEAVGQVEVAGTAAEATLTLANGQPYTFEVTVQYGGSDEARSARSALVTPTATSPDAPTILRAVSGARRGEITAQARWSAPANNGGAPLVSYSVSAWRRADNTLIATAVVPATSTQYDMALPQRDWVYFTVVATNAVGDSPASARSNTVRAR